MRFLRAFGRRLWRERRRMALCALLLFASGYLQFIHHGASQWGPSMAVVAGSAYVAVMLPTLLALCLIVRPWRFTCEIVTATLLIVSVWGVFDNRVGIDFALRGKSPSVWIVLGSWLVLTQLWCSTLVDRIRLRRGRSSYTQRSPLDARTLWEGLVGSPDETAPPSVTGEVVTFERLEPGRPHRRVVERLPGGALVEEHEFVEVEDAPRHIRFRWHAVNAAPGDPCTSGLKEVTIRETRRGSVVRVRQWADRMPLRVAIQAWLDDGLARLADRKLALVERRAPPTAPPSAPDSLARPA